MLELSKLNRGTIVWSALLAAGVAGTVVDPNEPIGITSFGIAAAVAVYLSDENGSSPPLRRPLLPLDR